MFDMSPLFLAADIVIGYPMHWLAKRQVSSFTTELSPCLPGMTFVSQC